MENMILILAAGSVFAVVFYAVQKLGDHWTEERISPPSSEGHILRIAFENPSMLAEVSVLLADYSGEEPTCQFFLSSGRGEDILKDLRAKELDFCFIAPFSEEAVSVDFCRILLFGEKEAQREGKEKREEKEIFTKKNGLEAVWMQAECYNQEIQAFAELLLRRGTVM